MPTTISSKRQIVIPKNDLIAVGLTEGSRVRVVRVGHTLSIVPDKTRDGSSIEDGPKILGYKGRKATQAEIRKAIAAGAAESL